MIPYPSIDPVIVSIGPVALRWYGMMYLIGFVAAWWLGRRRAQRSGGLWQGEEVGDLLYYGALGVILGGRIGYMLFYNFERLLAEPLSLFYIHQGGMSFHGGLLGVLVAVWLFARRTERSFFQVTDFVAPLVPLGLLTGRFGNFINHELPGRATDVAWALQFPGETFGRHPSSLYELVLEGIVLFVVLYLYSAKARPRMSVSGLFLLGYGSFRFLVEFVRQPDPQLGFIAFDWLTMGQLLSLPMILLGALLIVCGYTRHPLEQGMNRDERAWLKRRAQQH